jgi:hypothetical protein
MQFFHFILIPAVDVLIAIACVHFTCHLLRAGCGPAHKTQRVKIAHQLVADGWWLMTGAGLFGEKSTAGWLLVAGLF